ncbi:hypothetical protein BC831DRAFT_442914 [Entophlyctis helioformis]|nr:hypothetical protein BC831DRAFT_442914 [Entophlyctis helioformis]
MLKEQMCTTKSDIYSLGIVLVELLCLFQTAMERAVTLEALKTAGVVPPGLEKAFPAETRLVRLLLSEDPQSRPSALDVIAHISAMAAGADAGGQRDAGWPSRRGSCMTMVDGETDLHVVLDAGASGASGAGWTSSPCWPAVGRPQTPVGSATGGLGSGSGSGARRWSVSTEAHVAAAPSRA